MTFPSLHNRYSRANSGIRGTSLRVVLDGGLSPLPFNRKLVKDALSLNLSASGQTAASGAARVRAASTSSALLKRNLPPKVRVCYAYAPIAQG